MTVFYHEEEPTNPSKRCKFLAACLKDAFSNCHDFGGCLTTSNPDEEYPTSDFDEEQEVLTITPKWRIQLHIFSWKLGSCLTFFLCFQVVVSAIRSGALKKLRRKPILLMSDSFSWVYSPVTRELYITPKGIEQKEDMNRVDCEGEEFLSVKSCFSCCSSAASRDVFVSVKSSFSRSSSLNGVDLKEFQRRSIIQEFCHCEGWPFGLCRKAVLLPPLPKSPSESWSWRKGTKTAKLTYRWVLFFFLFFYFSSSFYSLIISSFSSASRVINSYWGSRVKFFCVNCLLHSS